MVVQPPRIAPADDRICVSYHVESSDSGQPAFDLVYEIAGTNEGALELHRLDAALVALLPLALARGEPIYLNGPISARLGYGIHEIQQVITSWHS